MSTCPSRTIASACAASVTNQPTPVGISAFGNRRHEGRPPRHGADIRRVEAEAHIDQVQPARFEAADELDGFFQRLTFLIEIGNAQPRAERIFLRPHSAHRLQRLEKKARAVLETAAIFIAALVGDGRKETLAEIAVREMQLQPFEAGGQRTLCRRNEIAAHAGNFILRHFVRHAREIAAEGPRRWRNWRPCTRLAFRHVIVAFPRAIGRGLAARMSDLNSRHGVALHERGDGRPGLRLRIVPDAGIGGRDAALGRHRARLRDDERSPAHRAGTQMHEVPGVGHALFRRILAHGRNRDAIFERDVLQAELAEQRRHGAASFVFTEWSVRADV